MKTSVFKTQFYRGGEDSVLRPLDGRRLLRPSKHRSVRPDGRSGSVRPSGRSVRPKKSPSVQTVAPSVQTVAPSVQKDGRRRSVRPNRRSVRPSLRPSKTQGRTVQIRPDLDGRNPPPPPLRLSRLLIISPTARYFCVFMSSL